MMSANVDTRHMGGNSKKDPSYHNLDWITRLNFSSQKYIGMLKTLPSITPLKLKNSRDKYQQLTCNTIEDLVAGCEGTSVDQFTYAWEKSGKGSEVEEHHESWSYDLSDTIR